MLKQVLVILMVLCLPVVHDPAWGQSLVEFNKDHLVIEGADGKSHGFEVELALSVDQQTQGLMFRRALPADAGMLFDFHQVKPIAMWMKNTLIPLDMIFIDDKGKILGVTERAVPQSLDILPSPGPIRAVLEVNGGTASRLGIKAGDKVRYALFEVSP